VLLVTLYLGCLAVIAAFDGWLAVTWVRARLRPERTPELPLDAFPMVTFQVAVCDEGPVVEGAVASIVALDYPRERYEIQLCDDSTDPASIAACERIVASYRAGGVAVTRLARHHRDGFKAANLNHARPFARGEYLALLDADFRIPPEFLRRTLPLLVGDARVAAVQTHFVHANAGRSLLTRAYEMVYDLHQRVEQLTRSNWGAWMEFMGSAGIWRARAVDECGGWPTETGTEDVHLSLLAQLRGWTIRFSTATTSVGRLPETPAAFRRQQVRWALSMGWLARRLGWRILSAPAPFVARLSGLLHVTAHFVYVAMAGVMLLSWPVARIVAADPGLRWVQTAAIALLGASIVLGGPIVGETNRRAGRRGLVALRAGFLLTYVNAGMSMLAARAYLAGLFGLPVREWRASGAAAGAERGRGLDLVLEALAVASAALAAWTSVRHELYLLPLPGLLFGSCTVLFLALSLRRGR
jgi:hypothetical protein